MNSITELLHFIAARGYGITISIADNDIDAVWKTSIFKNGKQFYFAE